MARGWITGILTGVVVSGLGLATASLVMGPVAPEPQPDMAAPEPAVPVPVPDAMGDVDAGAAVEAAPQPVAPAEAVAAEDTQPTPEMMVDESPAPDAGEADAAPAADLAPVEAPPVSAAPDAAAPDAAPDAEQPPADAPQAAPETMTAPEPPVEPEAMMEEAGEPAAAADAAAVEAAPLVEAAPQPAAEPEPVTEPAAEPEPDIAAVAPEPEATPEPAAAPDAPAERAALPQIVVEAAPGAAPAPAPRAMPETVMVSPEADLMPEAEGDPAAAVVTNRLPRIGDTPAPEVAAPVAVPALSRNAVAFAPTGDQPRLAFLLVDTGADDRAGLGDLAKLPFPVSVAVDASAADAEQAIAFYRAQGAEVVLEMPLPEGATATDVDVTVEAYGPLLDQAVAVLAEDDLGFQTLGEGAVQLATNLAESGHGLVSFPSGLNTGHKAALKEGVKAGLVFRDLDSEGQTGAVIRRFLDNAAFRARGEEGVIVVARTRAETLQALLEWSLGTRAQSVALAPVSAVLAGD